jgi:hypothetical protein
MGGVNPLALAHGEDSSDFRIGHNLLFVAVTPLLLFVHKRTFVIWPIWIPPRVGDDPSIVA